MVRHFNWPDRNCPTTRLPNYQILLALPLLLLVDVAAGASQDAGSATSILSAATTYVEKFLNGYANVVAEERYAQTYDRRTGGPVQQRQLLSDFLLVKPSGSDEWLQFRDVVTVDGVSIKDRNERLVDLFVRNPPADASAQLRQVWQENARYNLGPLQREANLPLVALSFLQSTYRERFEFSLDKPDPKSTDAVVSYRETARPTIIRGTGETEQPTHGRFWIDRATGTVRKSELKYEGPSAFTSITTSFRAEPGFDVLVPSEMIEDHSSPRTGRISGRATYAKFRRFAVTTDETLK